MGVGVRLGGGQGGSCDRVGLRAEFSYRDLHEVGDVKKGGARRVLMQMRRSRACAGIDGVLLLLLLLLLLSTLTYVCMSTR